MGIFDLVVEGLVEDVDVWEGPSEEDMHWYWEQTYVDPAEAVWE